MSQMADDNSAQPAPREALAVLAGDAAYFQPPDEAAQSFIPLPELLPALAWNVAVAFAVNLAASWVYDRVRSRQRAAAEQARLEEEIARLRAELARTRAGLQARDECLRTLKESNVLLASLFDPARSPEPPPEALAEVAALLERWGWPPPLARRRAREVGLRLMRYMQPGLDNRPRGGRP